MPPSTQGVVESSLYVSDVAESIRFYARIFGFEVLSDFGGRGCAMKAGDRQVLLLFLKKASLELATPHDGEGQLHVAFAIEPEDLERWEGWLAENGIEVEGRQSWPMGGRSLYFRDPDRHLLEVVTPGTWKNY